MRLTRRHRRRLCAAMLGVAAVALAGPTWLDARAGSPGVVAATGTLAASPQSDLADGQFVKVTFSGLAPSIGVAFRQCVPTPAVVATDCTAQNTQVTGVTDGAGAGSVYLPIHAGKLTAANGTATVTCDATHPCVIAAMPNLTDLSTALFTQTTFARSKDDCPPPSADAVLGSGSSSAYRAVYAWEYAACAAPASLSVGYTVSNSPDGMGNLLNGLTDFAVTGPFASVPTPITPPATPLTYRFAPLATSAVVLAYRMYDNTGPQIVSLTLTPDLVAGIFLGKIPNWAANAQIRALNPGVQFPTRIVPFVRAEHSAQSLVFTSWLAANAPASWTTGASDIFPIAPAGVQGVTGSTGLGLAVADPLTDWLGQGNIGFMDSSTAAFYGLPTATIKRADGSLMAATPAAITQAIVDATTANDGTLQLAYADANPLAYQMAMPSYLVAPTNTITPAHGAVLAGFLRYAVQNQGSLPPGYAPLPPALVDRSLAVAAAIPASAPATPKPAPTPTPTPAPTATPVPAPAAPVPPVSSGYSGFTVSRAPLAVLPPPAVAVAPTATAKPAKPTPTASVQAATSTTAPASLGFTRLGDSRMGRFVLPGIIALALLSAAAGGAIELLARRRAPVVAEGDAG